MAIIPRKSRSYWYRLNTIDWPLFYLETYIAVKTFSVIYFSLVRAPNRLSHYKVRHALYTPINFDRVINLCGTIAKKNSQTTASLSKNRKSFAMCLLHSFPFKYSRMPRMIIVSFKKMHMHSLHKMRHVEQNFPTQSNQSIPYSDYFQ